MQKVCHIFAGRCTLGRHTGYVPAAGALLGGCALRTNGRKPMRQERTVRRRQYRGYGRTAFEAMGSNTPPPAGKGSGYGK